MTQVIYILIQLYLISQMLITLQSGCGLTDAVILVVQCPSKLQSRRFVSLTEDPSLHVRGEVVCVIRRGQCRARVVATYPDQSRVDHVGRDQILSQEHKPELVVGGRGGCIVRTIRAHKGDRESQPVIVGTDSTEQLRCLQGVGVRGRFQGDVLVGDAEVASNTIEALEEPSREIDCV